MFRSAPAILPLPASPALAPRPVAGGQFSTRDEFGQSAAVGYEVWSDSDGAAWVILMPDDSTPFRLDASAVSALELVLGEHTDPATTKTIAVGVGRSGLELSVRQTWPLVGAAGVTVGLLVLAALAVVRSHRRSTFVRAVAHHEDATREAERARVAREIHDGPLQELARLARSSAPEVQRPLQEIGAELRALAGGLRPPALDRFGLGPALEDLADRWSRAAPPLVVRVEAKVAERLPEHVELAAYRIVQEALANAHAHGLAQTAWVFLHRRGAGAELLVRDDGDGIVPGRTTNPSHLVAEGHYGLAGMRERARAIGGTVRIDSGPGGFGTEVRFHVPRLSPRPRLGAESVS